MCTITARATVQIALPRLRRVHIFYKYKKKLWLFVLFEFSPKFGILVN